MDAQWAEALATMLVGKVPKTWIDSDRARFEIALSEMVRSFRHIEAIVFERGRRPASGDEPFMQWFFRSPQFVQFSRPVYIGIARNLYTRIYGQHFLSLTDYWDDHSRVSLYIRANSEASVQNVMDSLDIQHSFALEARVRVSPPAI